MNIFFWLGLVIQIFVTYKLLRFGINFVEGFKQARIDKQFNREFSQLEQEITQQIESVKSTPVMQKSQAIVS
jgi:hypothetical protein